MNSRTIAEKMKRGVESDLRYHDDVSGDIWLDFPKHNDVQPTSEHDAAPLGLKGITRRSSFDGYERSTSSVL